MSNQNTCKPNGRPPNTERNNKIIADTVAGVPMVEMVAKYGLNAMYLQKIASEHMRKLKEQKKANEGFGSVGLYAERDVQIKKFYKSLNTKGALSKLHIEDMGKINSGYTRKQT